MRHVDKMKNEAEAEVAAMSKVGEKKKKKTKTMEKRCSQRFISGWLFREKENKNNILFNANSL